MFIAAIFNLFVFGTISTDQAISQPQKSETQLPKHTEDEWTVGDHDFYYGEEPWVDYIPV